MIGGCRPREAHRFRSPFSPRPSGRSGVGFYIGRDSMVVWLVRISEVTRQRCPNDSRQLFRSSIPKSAVVAFVLRI